MEDLQTRIRGLAQAAVRHALQTYQIRLDYSAKSLRQVERILGQLHNTLPKGPLGRLFSRGATSKQISEMAAVYGAYIGEVIRARLGGEWSMQSSRHTEPTMTLRLRGEEIYPASKAYKRLVDGQEESIWAFYSALAKKYGNDDRQG